MIILTMNDKTGEVKEISTVAPFRSLLDLKDYKDGEDYEPGTSCTSLEGYEPLESIVARCTRTMVGPNGQKYQVLDKDALKAEETQEGLYEASSAKTLDEAFASIDPTDEQGFDLADASRIQKRVAEELGNAGTAQDVASPKLSTKGANEGTTYAGVSNDVENSGSTQTDEAFPEKEKSDFKDKEK